MFLLLNFMKMVLWNILSMCVGEHDDDDGDDCGEEGNEERL